MYNSISWQDHIESKPEVMYGKPVIRNTRVPVEIILEYLAGGESFEGILEGYPHITRQDIYACLAYAADSVKNEAIYSLAS